MSHEAEPKLSLAELGMWPTLAKLLLDLGSLKLLAARALALLPKKALIKIWDDFVCHPCPVSKVAFW